MGSTRQHFTDEYKANAVVLANMTAARSPSNAPYCVHEMTLGKWVKTACDEGGKPDSPLNEDERAELERLREEANRPNLRGVRQSATATDNHAGYAIGYLTDIEINDDLLSYMAQVETTMQEFGGHWVVHGTTPEWREGSATGDIVLIGFPNIETARAWYESDAYQAIIELRSRHSRSHIALLDGVPPGYSTRDTIAKLTG